jgi:EpsI family protein
MVLVGLALVLGLARLIQPREQPVCREAQPSAGAPAAPTRSARLASALLLLGVAAAAAMGLTGRSAEDASLNAAPIEEIPLTLGPWTGEDRAVPDVVSELLVPDRVVHRSYENNIGDRAAVWVLYWGTGAVMKGYHHPDVCWGNRGFQAADRWVEAVPVPGGGSVPVTARAFRQGREEQTVLYWTQEGRRVWTDADERAERTDMLSTSWHGHRWVDDLLGTSAEPRQSRFTVVVVVPSTRDRDRRNAAELPRAVAAELYRLCPWAAPRPPGGPD